MSRSAAPTKLACWSLTRARGADTGWFEIWTVPPEIIDMRFLWQNDPLHQAVVAAERADGVNDLSIGPSVLGLALKR